MVLGPLFTGEGDAQLAPSQKMNVELVPYL